MFLFLWFVEEFLFIEESKKINICRFHDQSYLISVEDTSKRNTLVLRALINDISEPLNNRFQPLTVFVQIKKY